MAQELLDLINKFGGADAVSAMAAKAGISPDQVQSAMGALMPMIAGGMTRHVETAGADSLNTAATTAATVANGTDVASDAAIDHGNSILGQLFGGHDVTQEVTAKAAAATGLDASTISSLLPMVATMAAGALGHQGAAAPTAEAPAEGGGLGGMLSGIIGSLTGGGATAGGAAGAATPPAGAAGTLLSIMDVNKDGNPLDDIMGFAKRFMKS